MTCHQRGKNMKDSSEVLQTTSSRFSSGSNDALYMFICMIYALMAGHDHPGIEATPPLSI